FDTRQPTEPDYRRAVVVVVRIRFADARQYVERGVSGADIVWIDARVDQRDGKLKMTVLHSERQRTSSRRPSAPHGGSLRGLHHRIRVTTFGEEFLDGIETSGTHSK